MKAAGFSLSTAIAVVVANMIGTGVFTSLGFQLLDIQSGFVLLMLWVVGGITALCGALSYAELGAALPRSGGEYNFLSRIYHPGAGFVSGWVSASIGFAAPTALAAITFGTYLASVYPTLSPTWLASALVLVLTLIHTSSHRNSGTAQRVFTYIKLVLIVLFCALALVIVETPQPISFLPQAGDLELVGSGAFAVALIFVNYAYTGWNAATYLSDEIDAPQRNLPRILLYGTAMVMLLYVLLNFTFLRVAPIEAMAGKLEVGFIAAQHVVGDLGATIMGIGLATLLISTVSAMILAGPRVLQVIGQDFSAFALLSRVNRDGVPAVAIGFQSVLTLAFIWTASFESILVFAGFTLGLNTLLTVLGLFVLRWKEPKLERPYRVFAYPLPPLLFLLLMGWTLAYILLQRPVEALSGLGIVVLGAAFYWLTARLSAREIASG